MRPAPAHLPLGEGESHRGRRQHKGEGIVIATASNLGDAQVDGGKAVHAPVAC